MSFLKKITRIRRPVEERTEKVVAQRIRETLFPQNIEVWELRNGYYSPPFQIIIDNAGLTEATLNKIVVDIFAEKDLPMDGLFVKWTPTAYPDPQAMQSLILGVPEALYEQSGGLAERLHDETTRARLRQTPPAIGPANSR